MPLMIEVNEQGEKILVQSGYMYIEDYLLRREVRWKCVYFKNLKCEGFCDTSSTQEDGYVVQESEHSHPSYQEKIAYNVAVWNYCTNWNPMMTPTPRETTLARPIALSINVIGYNYIGDNPRRRTLVWKWVNFKNLKCKSFCATSSAKNDGYVVQKSERSHPPYQEKMAYNFGVWNFHTNWNPMRTPTPREMMLNRAIAKSINVRNLLVDDDGYLYFRSRRYEKYIWKCIFSDEFGCPGRCKTSSWQENGVIMYVRSHNHPSAKQMEEKLNQDRQSIFIELVASVSKSLNIPNNIRERHVLDEHGYIYSYCPGYETLKWKCIYYKELECEGWCKTSSSRENGDIIHRHSHNHLPGSQERLDGTMSKQHNQLRELASVTSISNFHTNSNPMTPMTPRTPTPRETTLVRPIALSTNVGPPQPGQPFKFTVIDLKLECEKLASEKIEIQRHYVM
ncbi:Protein of unknown function, partial [Cotesia congregata]